MDKANIKEKWKLNTTPLWFGQFLSLFGSGVVQFAIIWHLTETTGSKVILALATYMGVIPGILLGSYIGNFVDRNNKKLLMVVSDLISAISIILISLLFFFKIQNISLLLLVLFIRSICSQIQSNALFVSIPYLVPQDVYEKVGGIRQTIDGIINLLSIPIAALLLSIVQIEIILLIDPITAILGIVSLLFVKFDPESKHTETERLSALKKLTNGFQILYGYKYIFRKAIISSAINLTLTPAIAFLPLLVTQNLDGGPKLLAILQTSIGIGIAVGGLIMSRWGGFNKRIVTLLGGDAVLGVSLVLAGIMTLFILPMLLILPLFLAGVALSVSNSSSAAITQSKIPQNDIGKVSGASVSLAQLMIPIGLTIAIPITQFIGITGWFILSGIVNTLIVIIFAFDKKFIYYSTRRKESTIVETIVIDET